MKLFDNNMIAQVAARQLHPGFQCKRDGMSTAGAQVLHYIIGGKRYECKYKQYRFQTVDGTTWEIWLTSIEEQKVTFYKNLHQVTVKQ